MKASSARPRRRLLARVAVVGAAAGGVLLFATPAFAHVRVTPDTAAQGSATELTFTVPNEEASAATTELQIQFPTDHPIAQLLPKAVPGWQVQVTTSPLATPLVTDDGTFTQAVSEITWTGGQIPVGQYQDFAVSADPLPTDTTSLVFKAVQTYSDGNVVHWIDLPQPPGSPAPDHPAPVLTLTAATSDAGSGPSASPASGTGSAASGSGGSDSTARAVGIAGLVVGVLGLLAGGVAILRARRTGRGGDQA